jgi:hypothetical protein
LHLAEDSAIHAYRYTAYKSDLRSFKPGISYSNEDRLFIGLDYRIQKQKWRKDPFAFQHDLFLNYSITQRAFSAKYKGVFNEVIGKWNLGLLADYDQVRDMHFSGIGNNSIRTSKEKGYYLFRDREFNANVTFFRSYGKFQTVSIATFYQIIKPLNDNSKYILGNPVWGNPSSFIQRQFAGARAEYNFETVKDKIFPSGGVRFSAGAALAQNIKETTKSYGHYSGIFGFYLPIAPSLTLGVKTGAETVTGEPEFYQLSRLGGGSTLRGFPRYRFYGKTAFHNQNELQWNFNVRSYLFNGKMGLLALLDNGRVWQPGEKSDAWHSGYGGGIMLAPFNKIAITATYAVSSDGGRLNARIGRLL